MHADRELGLAPTLLGGAAGALGIGAAGMIAAFPQVLIAAWQVPLRAAVSIHRADRTSERRKALRIKGKPARSR